MAKGADGFTPCPGNDVAGAAHNYQAITTDMIYCTQCGNAVVLVDSPNVT